VARVSGRLVVGRIVQRRVFLANALAFVVSAPAVPCAAAARIDEQLDRIAAASSGVLGVYARTLSPQASIALRADEVFPTASISKLVVLLALYRRAEREPALLDRIVVLERSDFVPGSDILDGYAIGSSITVRRLAAAMIEQSDNSASNVLIDLLGFATLQRTIAAVGMRRTKLVRHYADLRAIARHNENVTTPRDMGTLLYAIERGAHEGVTTVATPASCRAMIELMLRGDGRDKIAMGLPRARTLANKVGEMDDVRNDVGIVDPRGETPYVLAVLAKDLGDFSLGNLAIRHVAAAVDAVYR